MSAHTEHLLEDIKQTENALKALVAQQPATPELKAAAAQLQATLDRLRSQLTAASSALTEGKGLLKD